MLSCKMRGGDGVLYHIPLVTLFQAFGPGLQGARAGKNVEFTIQTRYVKIIS
jgi:hypothetical protein